MNIKKIMLIFLIFIIVLNIAYASYWSELEDDYVENPSTNYWTPYLNLSTIENYYGNFYGFFNWTTGDSYNSFNGNTLFFNESKLNDTIDAITTSINYYPSSYYTLYGVETGGNNIGNISFIDDVSANWSESAGMNALEIYVNFTLIDTIPDFLIMSHQYDGTHYLELQIWDYNNLGWEIYDTITPQASIIKEVIAIVDGSNHINNSLVQIRFIHPSNGNINDNFYLDMLQVVKGFSTIITSEHDGLSGRNNQETNHIWAMPKNSTSNLTTTGVINATGECHRFGNLIFFSNETNGYIELNGTCP